jgi:hypothetical protein
VRHFKTMTHIGMKPLGIPPDLESLSR